MSKKENELRGGLNALFGGNSSQNQREPLQEPDGTTESSSPQMEVEQTTEEDEQDLINSVEDEALREALRKKRMDGRGRPRKDHDKSGSLTNGYSRTSLILNTAKQAKIKEIAFRETLTMKEIFEAALDMLIEKYEAKHGEVVPRPEKYKGNIKDIFND